MTRVLLVPELYRPDDLSANGTVNDLATLVGRWLSFDDSLHVYWLLPPRVTANYGASDVLADRERVTLLEAEPFGDGGEWANFTEHGYTRAQLRALREGIFEAGAYLDVVVDQLRSGRFTLYKWLLRHTDHWAAQSRPFDVVANVHDLQVPFKYRYCAYRNEFQSRMECCAAAFADGIWFQAGADRRAFDEHARAFLRDDVVDAALAESVEVGSPLELSAFEERYREEPRWLHLAGSLWAKKRADRTLDWAERLHERYGIRTVLTSPEPVPDGLGGDWLTVRENADRETYEAALRRGDLAVCASEYETAARTPFEQAASGQVLVLRDEPWIRDCVPPDHPLVAPLDELEDLLRRAVERWGESVEANRRLVAHVREVRAPDRCARLAYDDVRRRVDEKVAGYEPDADAAAVEAALAAFDGPVALDELVARTADRAEGGVPIPAREDGALADVVCALRALGYRDAGNPGTPRFRRVDAGAAPGGSEGGRAGSE